MKRLVAAVALALMATSAQATWVSCVPSVADNVTPNIGCETNSAFDQDFLNTNPMTVNADGGAFDITNWFYLTKNDPPVLGVWNFGALYPDMMLVYKYGSEPFNAYLVNTVSGTWTQEFARNISHITYYVRGTPTTVPEPTSLALMFAGLLGLAVTRRKVA